MALRVSATCSSDGALISLISSSAAETIAPAPMLPWKPLVETRYWSPGDHSVSHGTNKSAALLVAISQALRRILKNGNARLSVSRLPFCGVMDWLCYLASSSLGRRHCVLHCLFYRTIPDADLLCRVQGQILYESGQGLAIQPCRSSEIAPASLYNSLDPPLQRFSISVSKKQGKPDRRLSQEGFDIQPDALRANHLSSFQIQITLLSGRTMLHWVQATDLVQDLLNNLEHRLGIPSELQRLLHKGKQLENPFPLSYYSINRDASIVLSLRLRGGAPGQPSSTPAFSYKDAVHAQLPKKSATSAEAPKPFLVDKMEEAPSIEISNPSLDEQIQTYAESAIISRFNGFWPRTTDLYQWIHGNWTDTCQVFLCSKGFFIVMFAFNEDYQKALTGGPWFWGAAGLFLTPWFPDFNPSSAVVTKLPIWVRLPNLPAHLWHVSVFQGIGNALGRFLATDTSRGEKGIYTYGRICAEIDLSKGLPDQINLKIGDFHCTQTLDYENTAFRCIHCHQTGHLQNTCSSFPDRKKKTNSKPKSKSWKPCDPPHMNDLASSSSDEEDLEEEGEKDVHQQASPSAPPIPQKRLHESSSSDSDKETPSTEQNNLQLVPAQPNHNGWVKVIKKKGKKVRLEISAHSG